MVPPNAQHPRSYTKLTSLPFPLVFSEGRTVRLTGKVAKVRHASIIHAYSQWLILLQSSYKKLEGDTAILECSDNGNVSYTLPSSTWLDPTS